MSGKEEAGAGAGKPDRKEECDNFGSGDNSLQWLLS